MDIYHGPRVWPGTIRHDMDQLPAGVNMEPHHGGLDPSVTQYFMTGLIIIISVIHANVQITRNILIGVL